MIQIPLEFLTKFESILRTRSVPTSLHNDYIKWVRYYIDFCVKYNHPYSGPESLNQFINKLKEKNQTEKQQKQAKDAVYFYYKLKNQKKPDINDNTNKIPVQTQPNPEAKKAVDPAAVLWNKAFSDLSDEINVRHYSPRTLEVYVLWAKKFQGFTRNKDPMTLTPEDAKEYMKYLAVTKKVSASTQNQSLNAILFFYKHILKKDIGNCKDIVRAKSKPHIPVVLSRQEIDKVLQNLSYPYDLVVKLLYGCGLRLFECLQLRVQNFNFDAGILTVHDGKGKKDRTVPIPQSIMPELSAHLDRVITLHQKDLDADYAGVFMTGLLDKKYINSAKELVWQWFFPAKTLTKIPGTNEYRRYYLHKTHVQKAIRQAVRKSKLLKRVSAHTFRHSFATHLLQANYDIRTIQDLLGHSDVRTMMIYTHTVKSLTLKEAISPLDF